MPRCEAEYLFAITPSNAIPSSAVDGCPPREQFERIGRLIDCQLAPGHDARRPWPWPPSGAVSRAANRPHRRPTARHAAGLSGTGVSTAGQHPDRGSVDHPRQRRAAHPRHYRQRAPVALAFEPGGQLLRPWRGRCRISAIRQTPSPASAKAIALPTPPAPITATAPCEERGDEFGDSARETGRVGIVADQPAVADHDGVDRADQGGARR